MHESTSLEVHLLTKESMYGDYSRRTFFVVMNNKGRKKKVYLYIATFHLKWLSYHEYHRLRDKGLILQLFCAIMIEC